MTNRRLDLSAFPVLYHDGQRLRLQQNGLAGLAGDHVPVVRLSAPGGRPAWLLTALSPHDAMNAWGLADYGVGSPEEGPIDLTRVAAILHAAGAGPHGGRDDAWDARGRRLSQILAESRRLGRLPD